MNEKQKVLDIPSAKESKPHPLVVANIKMSAATLQGLEGMPYFDNQLRFTTVCTILLDLIKELRKNAGLSIRAVQINSKEAIDFENPLQPKIISFQEASQLSSNVFLDSKSIKSFGSDLNLKEFGKTPVSY